MKPIILGSALTAVLLLLAFVGLRAAADGRRGWYGCRWHHPWPGSYLARELNLSDAQRTQIKTLWQEERPAMSGHVHELLAEETEMNAIARTTNPDPNDVKKIADQEANTISALLMEKSNLQAKIYSTVLNSDQRAKAAALQKKWESRLDRFAERIGTAPDAK